MHKNSALTVLAMLGVLSLPLHAQENNVAELDEVSVIAKEATKANGEIKKSRRAIQDELISDTRDLVRYTTDVGISDNGRHNKGFAMRGVEGNRVGISIDGVALPDSEENSLYARYGNFNSSRIQIDPELVTGIDVMRGADSFNQGSGALGGGVSYRTLQSEDILQGDNRFGALLKSGYASKNREWTYTTGLAYKGEQLEATALYSQRKGHELSSTGNGADIIGSDRGIPDPSNHRNHNYLARIAYLFADKHKISALYTGQEHVNHTDEKSYTFIGSWRNTFDYTNRHNLNLAYEYFPTSGILGYLKTEYDYMKTVTGAVNLKGSEENDITQTPRILGEVDERQFRFNFQRLALRLDSTPFETIAGSHLLTFKTAYSHRLFENLNHKLYGFAQNYQSSELTTIQHPIQSTEIYASLLDQIAWSEKWASQLGIRYDYTQFKPKSLNAACRSCSNVPVKSTTFKSIGGHIGIDYQLNDTWKTSYYFSSAYRVPSASEMYFTFESDPGSWLSNPQLKPELSRNHLISLQGENEKGSISLNLYRTDYHNFLYEQERLAWKETTQAGASQQTFRDVLVQQAINIDKARVVGLDINSRLNIGQLVSFLPNGLNTMGAVGYSKGKFHGRNESMLPIQPLKVILGLGYDDPQHRWGIQTRWTYVGAKKEKDAQILRYYYDQNGGTKPFPYLSKSAVLFDTFGFVKVGKNVTLRAGVYNLFNRKYHTWDALRGIPNTGSTTNAVGRDHPERGLERFHAPGRNFAASVEIRF